MLLLLYPVYIISIHDVLYRRQVIQYIVLHCRILYWLGLAPSHMSSSPSAVYLIGIQVTYLLLQDTELSVIAVIAAIIT